MAGRRPSPRSNLSYAGIAGLAGCATVALVLVALIAGLWLDAQFGRRGPFTMGLLVISVPISLFIMVRLSLAMIKQITPPPREAPQEMGSDTKED